MIRKRVLNKASSAAALLLLGLTSQAGIAQDTFTASGPINYGYFYDYQSGTNLYLQGGSYQATVNHDSTSPLTYSGSYSGPYYTHYYSQWNEALKSIDYVVFDADGNQVFEYTQTIDNADYYWSSVYKGGLDYSQYYDDYRHEQWYLDTTIYDSNVYKWGYAAVYATETTPITADYIAGLQTYPNIFDNVDWDYTEFYSWADEYDYNTYSGSYHYVSGPITEVGSEDVDTDGDGVLDSEDACVDSDLSATVVVGDNDSGVNNLLLNSGCTISDTINTIQADEEKHGKVVSGVSHFLNYLKDEDIISGREKGAIQSATAGTNGKGKNK